MEAEVAAGGHVDLDDGRYELVAGGGGGDGGGGRDADGGLHSYAGELVSCLSASCAAFVRPVAAADGARRSRGTVS